MAALNQLCGEASLLAKNPELLKVTKYCIEGADMLRSIADIWDIASGVAENDDERSFKAAFHQDTQVGEVYKEFISDEPTRTSSSRRWRSSEEFLTTAGFERHDRRISKFRDRNWGKVFTLSVIKAPKLDFYARGAKDDYQKNWDLGLVYQNELRASMKNLAYAMRRDEGAHQHKPSRNIAYMQGLGHVARVWGWVWVMLQRGLVCIIKTSFQKASRPLKHCF